MSSLGDRNTYMYRTDQSRETPGPWERPGGETRSSPSSGRHKVTKVVKHHTTVQKVLTGIVVTREGKAAAFAIRFDD